APRVAELAWKGTSFTYDGKSHAPTATVSNLVSGDECDVTVEGAKTDVGTHTATATKLSNANYALPKEATCAFEVAPRVAELSWKGTSFTYDGKSHAPTATVANLVAGDTCDVTVAGAKTDAGTYEASATRLSNANYVLPKGAKCAFGVAPRVVELSWADKSFSYDGKGHAPTATVANLVSGDECAVTVAGAKTDAGTYEASATKLSNANYVLPKGATCKFAIAKAKLTSIAKVADQAYAGKAIVPKPTVKSGSKALKAGTDFVYGYKANAKPGTATVTATGKGNYQGTVKATFRIVAATTSGRAHLQGSGWQPTKSDPAMYGTTGRSLRMEALSLSLPKGFPVKGSIQYRAHVQGIGWQGWRADGATSGTIGESRRIEAVQIRLTGEVAKRYDVYYRVHVQRLGWMGWAKNGAKAGSEGQSMRAEAVQVVLVPKGAAAPGATYRGQTRAYAKAFVK
ncbi:MAG: hypothetical protein IKG21_09630, partial [Atopobiaceae bacterium]|nr:hypothetical protein [Atopobiaceae bacterium]